MSYIIVSKEELAWMRQHIANVIHGVRGLEASWLSMDDYRHAEMDWVMQGHVIILGQSPPSRRHARNFTQSFADRTFGVSCYTGYNRTLLVAQGQGSDAGARTLHARIRSYERYLAPRGAHIQSGKVGLPPDPPRDIVGDMGDMAVKGAFIAGTLALTAVLGPLGIAMGKGAAHELGVFDKTKNSTIPSPAYHFQRLQYEYMLLAMLADYEHSV